jgi:hypothetical protein
MKAQKRHVFWSILIRLIAVTSILVSVVIIQSSTTDFIPLIPFYYLVLLTYLLSLIYLLLYLWWTNYTVQAYFQTIVDLLLITALVYISGGLSGSLYLLYVFAVVEASIVVSNRAAYFTAGLSAILFGLLVDGLVPGTILRVDPLYPVPGLESLFYHCLPRELPRQQSAQGKRRALPGPEGAGDQGTAGHGRPVLGPAGP